MTKRKPIDIKGKDYYLVKDRVLEFNERFPNGSINTEILSALDSTRVIVKACVTPDINTPQRVFTDYSQASWDDKFNKVNQSSALENASTSATGRALALMGIGVVDAIASADEMAKAGVPRLKEEKIEIEDIASVKIKGEEKATNHKIMWIFNHSKAKGMTPYAINKRLKEISGDKPLSRTQATEVIEKLEHPEA